MTLSIVFSMVFRSGRSCITQLLHHLDDAMESLTNNLDFDSIYLYFPKAFDKVDHEIIMKKTTTMWNAPKNDQLESLLPY